VKRQSAAAIDTILRQKVAVKEYKKFAEDNYNADVKDFEVDLKNAMTLKIDSFDRDRKVSKVLAQINYAQIGKAMELIKDYNFKQNRGKYSFMERDFGFFMVDFYDRKSREEFITYYSTHTETETYTHYLDAGAIDYKNIEGAFDYDKIYDILNYDVVNAFVGGGGGTEDNEVYLVIKLLELKFKTTLGFPDKLCNSGNNWACNSARRAREWRAYLKDKGLLKLQHTVPVSFNYIKNDN